MHRSGDRFLTPLAGGWTRHSFSFGPHYDPRNTSFGALALHDEHVLQPGAGFPLHPHRDVEVVTWVVDGVLLHEDASGTVRELGAGSVQRMSAGGGVVHAERAGAAGTRFIQAWLLPDRHGGAPSYRATTVQPEALVDRLLPVCGPLAAASAVLHAGRLQPGRVVPLPEGGRRHLFVVRGAVELPGVGRLATGDAVRLSGPGAAELGALGSAEVLLWSMETQVTPESSRPGMGRRSSG